MKDFFPQVIDECFLLKPNRVYKGKVQIGSIHKRDLQNTFIRQSKRTFTDKNGENEKLSCNQVLRKILFSPDIF